MNNSFLNSSRVPVYAGAHQRMMHQMHQTALTPTSVAESTTTGANSTTQVLSQPPTAAASTTPTEKSYSDNDVRQVVINTTYGGFNLSDKAFAAYRVLAQIPMTESLDAWDIKRDDFFLIEVVETLKEEANGRFSKLKIVEIPSDVVWSIEEYDGAEWISEDHRTWR